MAIKNLFSRCGIKLAMQTRATRRELEKLDSRALKDIGISPSEIKSVAREAAIARVGADTEGQAASFSLATRRGMLLQAKGV